VKWITIFAMLLIVFLYGMLNLTMGLRWGKRNADKFYAAHPVSDTQVIRFKCTEDGREIPCDFVTVPAPPKTPCDPGDIYLPASGGMWTCNDGRNAWRPLKNGEEVQK
jgi:hypothetical protein